MRDILEQMRDEIVAGITDKGEALSAFDAIGALIDKACELATEGQAVEVVNPPTIQVVAVKTLKDILNECLSSALTPLPASPKKRTAVSSKKAKPKKAQKRAAKKR